MADLEATKNLAKSFGCSDKELEGLSEAQIYSLIGKKAQEKEAKLNEESERKAFADIDNILTKFKTNFTTPIEIWVKEFGQKKSPTMVKLIGYIPESNKYICYSNNNLHKIEESKILKTKDEKDKIEARLKEERKEKAAETKAKKNVKK